MEVWKNIPDYDGRYQASNLGNIRSFLQNQDGKLIIGGLDKDGYRIGVFRHPSGKRKTEKFHRMICKTFLETYSDGLQVNHKNGVKDDNKLSNLEMITCSANNKHKYQALGVEANFKSVAIAQLDINTQEVLNVYKSATACQKYGFSRTKVYAVCRGYKKYKSHKGYKWRYADSSECNDYPVRE